MNTHSQTSTMSLSLPQTNIKTFIYGWACVNRLMDYRLLIWWSGSLLRVLWLKMSNTPVVMESKYELDNHLVKLEAIAVAWIWDNQRRTIARCATFAEKICVSFNEVRKSCGSEWIEKIQVVVNSAWSLEELALENQRLEERCIEIGFVVRCYKYSYVLFMMVDVSL